MTSAISSSIQRPLPEMEASPHALLLALIFLAFLFHCLCPAPKETQLWPARNPPLPLSPSTGLLPRLGAAGSSSSLPPHPVSGWALAPSLIFSSPWTVCRGDYKGVDWESRGGIKAALDHTECLLDSPRPAEYHGEERAAYQIKHLPPPPPLLPSRRHLTHHRAVSYAGGSLGRQEALAVFLCLFLCPLSSNFFSAGIKTPGLGKVPSANRSSSAWERCKTKAVKRISQ